MAKPARFGGAVDKLSVTVKSTCRPRTPLRRFVPTAFAGALLLAKSAACAQDDAGAFRT